MNRRAVLLAAGTVIGTSGLSGCLAEGSGDPSPSPDAESPTATPSDDPATDSPTPFEYASDQPDPDLGILAENHHDGTHAITLAVEQDGETLHEATYDLEPDADRELYNLRETDPDGIESFTVRATLGDREESVDVRTDACHGHVVVYADEGGDLGMTYAIC